MEQILIVLAVAALAALSNWLQSRGQSSDEPAPSRDRPAPAPPPVQRRTFAPRPQRPEAGPPRAPAPAAPLETILERELRRLLGGEEFQSTPPTRPAPPAPAAPIPTSTHAPVPPAAHRLPPASFEPAKALRSRPEALPESTLAHTRAQYIGQDVGHRFQDSGRLAERHRHDVQAAAQARASAKSPAFSALVRSPEAARQAFIASLIFGKPKAFEAD